MIYSLYEFVHEQLSQKQTLGLLDHKEIERLDRNEYIDDVTFELTWVFLSLAILLTISIGFAILQLLKG